MKDNQRFQQILSTAAKIFRTKGYHNATVQEIADGIGMQKGSLYYYMKSKEELLYEIINSSTNNYLESLFEIINPNEPADIIIKKAIWVHMQPIEKEHDKIYVFINEFQSLSDNYRMEAEIKVHQYENLFKSIIDRGKKEGVFKPETDSKIILLGMVGMCNWTVRWYQTKKKFCMKEISGMYADMVLEGIRIK